MFSFSKDALDLIGQGTVKKSKMAHETIGTTSPQTPFEDSERVFSNVAAVAATPYTTGSSADEINPAKDDDIFFVTNALAVPLAVKYASKDASRVLFVESSEARVRSAVISLKASDASLEVATGIAFEYEGPRKVTVVSAITLAGLLMKRKNLNPFTHVIVNNVTSFSIGAQVLLGQLRRLINNHGAKGHHRVLLCGDVQTGLDIIKPAFNKLKVSGMNIEDVGAFVSIDTVASFVKKQIVKIPASNLKAPFVPYTAFATDLAKDVVSWVASSVKATGAIVVLGQTGLELGNVALPLVHVEKAHERNDGLFVVVASCAEEVVESGVRPVAVIDLGVSTVRSSNSPAEALLQYPQVEFASIVEISQRRALAGNHPYFALYPSAAPRPLRSFDAVLSLVERNELLQATKSGLDFRAFVAPIRESALDEALTAFSELGLIQSKAEPIQTFLGEMVARMGALSAEMGTFVALATALGLGDVAAAIAASNSINVYVDTAQKAALRSKYDPDDSYSSDVLADGVVLLTESEHAALNGSKITEALVAQSSILRTLANYQPPHEKRSLGEQRAALLKNSAVLAYLLLATFSTNSCKVADRKGELLNIRSTEKVSGPNEGSVVNFPIGGAMATAARLAKNQSEGISFDDVTVVSTNYFNAAQVLLRPVVHHSAAADTNTDGESIVRFAVSSNGLSTNYHVPVVYANRIIEARAALCTALGLLMLRRLQTPHATSAEEFVSAIRRKRRDFNFVRHIEETARKLELIVQESPVTFVISTFVKKQASVLSPSEVGIVEEGLPAAVATDIDSFRDFFEKNTKKTKKDIEPAAATVDSAPNSTADVPVVPDTAQTAHAEEDDDDEDYFAKHGPIMDDDDE